jgi:hypothetical protein
VTRSRRKQGNWSKKAAIKRHFSCSNCRTEHSQPSPFLRGNEPYKYSFGCKERQIHSIVLETKSGRNLGGRIDPKCIPDLLNQATELHRKAQSADAEIKLGRMAEVNAALLAAIEPASAPSVRKWRNWQTPGEHSVSA